MSRGVSGRDTIAAIATPPGRGGIGVIRISGDLTKSIIKSLALAVPRPRYAKLTSFRSRRGETIDTGLALFFPGPHSFTGEDVVELHGHGGPVVMDMLLNEIVGLGARIALPGEFSERAFLNDKIDLSQAEAIADLIDSVSEQAARGAIRSLVGEFSARIQKVDALVVNLRMFVEAAIDFPEEEIDFLNDERVRRTCGEIEDALDETLQQASQGALLKEGITLVIAGRPNAGKSSLMNALTGADSSIVTSIPGTTRDVVRELIHIDGIPLNLVDTAGIRHTTDEVEVEGVRRALGEARRADQVLVVVDLAAERESWREQVDQLMAEIDQIRGVTLVLNKRDLAADLDVGVQQDAVLVVSARTGEGISRLKSRIKQLAGYDGSIEGVYLARRRHLEALTRAALHVRKGREQLELSGAGELLAEDLRLCHEALTEITGEFSSDDLLGRIFSSFCIGK